MRSSDNSRDMESLRSSDGSSDRDSFLSVRSSDTVETKMTYDQAKQSLDAAKALVEASPQIETFRDQQTGATALHDAVKRGDVHIVNAILDKYPKLLEAQDNNGKTPLHYAAENLQGTIFKALQDKGANIAAKDNFNQTPYFLQEGALEIHGQKMIQDAAKSGNTDRVTELLKLDHKLADANLVKIATENGQPEVLQAIAKFHAERKEEAEKQQTQALQDVSAKKESWEKLKQQEQDLGVAEKANKHNEALNKLDQAKQAEKKAKEKLLGLQQAAKVAKTTFDKAQKDQKAALKVWQDRQREEAKAQANLRDFNSAKKSFEEAEEAEKKARDDLNTNNTSQAQTAQKEAQKKKEAAKKEFEKKQKQFPDAEKKHKEAQAALGTAEKDFNAKQEALKSAEQALTENNNALTTAQSDLDAKQKATKEHQKDFDQKQRELTSAQKELGKIPLQTAETAYNEAIAKQTEIDRKANEVIAVSTGIADQAKNSLEAAEQKQKEIGTAKQVEAERLRQVEAERLRQVEEEKLKQEEALAKANQAAPIKQQDENLIDIASRNAPTIINEQKARPSPERLKKLQYVNEGGGQDDYDDKGQRAMSDPTKAHVVESVDKDGKFSYHIERKGDPSDTKIHKVESEDFGTLYFDANGKMVHAELNKNAELNLAPAQLAEAKQIMAENSKSRAKATQIDAAELGTITKQPTIVQAFPIAEVVEDEKDVKNKSTIRESLAQHKAVPTVVVAKKQSENLIVQGK